MPKRDSLPKEVAQQLIQEVRERECLWNPDDSGYNDRYQMANAWSEIEDELKIPEDRIRAKWKNLRDLFVKEVRKFGPVEEYSGRWHHFDDMKFLHRPEQNTEQIDDNEANQDVEEYLEDDEGNEVAVFYDQSYEDPLPEKRKRKASNDDDYDEMFLKSLAPFFKQLDPIRKLVVRSKMQDMLLNEIAAQTSAKHLQIKTMRNCGD